MIAGNRNTFSQDTEVDFFKKGGNNLISLDLSEKFKGQTKCGWGGSISRKPKNNVQDLCLKCVGSNIISILSEKKKGKNEEERVFSILWADFFVNFFFPVKR